MSKFDVSFKDFEPLIFCSVDTVAFFFFVATNEVFSKPPFPKALKLPIPVPLSSIISSTSTLFEVVAVDTYSIEITYEPAVDTVNVFAYFSQSKVVLLLTGALRLKHSAICVPEELYTLRLTCAPGTKSLRKTDDETVYSPAVK